MFVNSLHAIRLVIEPLCSFLCYSDANKLTKCICTTYGTDKTYSCSLVFFSCFPRLRTSAFRHLLGTQRPYAMFCRFAETLSQTMDLQHACVHVIVAITINNIHVIKPKQLVYTTTWHLLK